MAAIISIPCRLGLGIAKLCKFAGNIDNLICAQCVHGYADSKQIDFTYNLFAFFSFAGKLHPGNGMQYVAEENTKVYSCFAYQAAFVVSVNLQ